MFNQTTEYALRAMACLAYQPEEMVPTAELARLTKVPPNYLAKVLQELAGADLIVGRRGVGGGYRLARPPGSIRLLDVINAISRVERIRTCPLGLETHGPNLCPLHRRIDSAAEALINIYGGVTLQDVVSDSNVAQRPLCDTGTSLRISAPSRR